MAVTVMVCALFQFVVEKVMVLVERVTPKVEVVKRIWTVDVGSDVRTTE